MAEVINVRENPKGGRIIKFSDGKELVFYADDPELNPGTEIEYTTTTSKAGNEYIKSVKVLKNGNGVSTGLDTQLQISRSVALKEARAAYGIATKEETPQDVATWVITLAEIWESWLMRPSGVKEE